MKKILNKKILSFLLGVLVFGSLAIGLSFAGAVFAFANDKVNLCHQTSSESNAWNIINVDKSSKQTHLNDGDFDYTGTSDPKEDKDNAEKWCADNQPVDLCLNIPGYQQTVPDGMQADENKQCTEVPTTATISATKIVCDNESDLPNWGSGGPDITSTTVSDFLVSHQSCHSADWTFEWSKNGVSNPGDNVTTGGNGWTPFTNTATVDAGSKVWVREEANPDYIPFTGDTTNSPDGNVSAELYCNTDVLNYDNWDYIDPVVAGQTYYCVGFNVPKEQPKEPQQCDIISDTTNVIQDNTTPAALTFVHSGWVQSIVDSAAKWIWNAFHVTDPTQDETETFTKTFTVNGPIDSATIQMAADNGYKLEINGGTVIDKLAIENNFSALQAPTDVKSFLQEGTNTIKFTVKNFAVAGSTSESNPAGLLYDLTVKSASCSSDSVPEKPKTSQVTMCKTDSKQNLLSGWQLMLLGNKFGSTTVNPTGVNSTITNVPAGNYVIKASGQYTYRGTVGAEFSDAAYSKRAPSDSIYTTASSDPTQSTYLPWVRENNFPAPHAGWLGIIMNNAATDWGSMFNPSHIYALGTTTTSTSDMTFKILDDQYSDNSGSLNVDVYNGYQGTTSDNGCVTFDNVPYGSYTTDEIMQNGWENVSGLGPVDVNQPEQTFNIINSNGSEPQITCDPKINLLENGGFESPALSTGVWDIVPDSNPLLKWIVAWVGTPASGRLGLEIQNHVAGTPSEGSQLAELDGDHPVTIWQDIPTIPGKVYNLNFAYSPRPHISDNKIEVKADGSLLGTVLSADGTSNSDTVWTPETRSFIATGNTTKVEFTDTSADTSTGGYLDNVGLYCQGDPKKPTTGNIEITKYVCPVDTTVTRSANGINGEAPNGCTLEEGETFGYAHGDQTDANSPYPELTAPVTEGGSTNSSGILNMSNLDATGRYLITETDGKGNKLGASDILGLYCEGDGDTSNTNDNQELTFVPAGGTAHCVAYNKATEEPQQEIVNESIVVKSADLANNTSDVISDSSKWFFYNDETDQIDSTLGSFVTGPGTAPLGTGSAQITVNGTQRRNIATYQFSGVKLADITNLSFSTYSQLAGDGSNGLSGRAPYLNFNVDFNGSDTWQKRLVYIPEVNGTVVSDTWQNWDTINSGNGSWTWSGYVANGNKWPDNNTNEYRTWSDLVSSFPNLAVRTNDSWFGFRVGEPYANGFTGNIDNVVVGTKNGLITTIKTFDFEPTQQVNPTHENVAPTANAGIDQSITLPTNSITLNGSGSSDSDGTINSYTWTESSGPSTINPNDVSNPTVSGLVAGTYIFSLVVTDNDGASSSPDTVQIIVNPVITFSGSYLRVGSIPTGDTTGGEVLGVEKYNFTLNLRIGSRGDEVMELQKFLNAAGYDCGIPDGKFGIKTKNALIKFQLANGLVGDGIVGPLTRAVLNK